MGLDALEDFMRKGICLNFQGDLPFLLLPCALESEKGQFEGGPIATEAEFCSGWFSNFQSSLEIWTLCFGTVLYKECSFVDKICLTLRVYNNFPKPISATYIRKVGTKFT